MTAVFIVMNTAKLLDVSGWLTKISSVQSANVPRDQTQFHDTS